MMSAASEWPIMPKWPASGSSAPRYLMPTKLQPSISAISKTTFTRVRGDHRMMVAAWKLLPLSSTKVCSTEFRMDEAAKDHCLFSLRAMEAQWTTSATLTATRTAYSVLRSLRLIGKDCIRSTQKAARQTWLLPTPQALVTTL